MRFAHQAPLRGIAALVFALPLVLVPIGAFQADVFSEPKRLIFSAFALVFAATRWARPRLAAGGTGFALAWAAALASAATSSSLGPQLPLLVCALAVLWAAASTPRGPAGDPGAAKAARLLASALLAAGALETLLLTLQAAGLDPLATETTRAFQGRWHLYGTLGNPNRVGWFLSVCLTVAVATLPESGAALGLCAWLGLGLLLALSRGAWLASLASLLLLRAIATRTHEQRVFARAALVLGGAILLAGLASMALLPAWTSAALSNLGSLQGRWITWKDALALGSRHPWLGMGLGEFSRQSAATPNADPAFRVEYVHGEYLGLFVELGLIGLAALLWALASRLGNGLRLWRQEGDAPARLGLAAVLPVLVLSLFDFPLREPSVLLPFLLGLFALGPAAERAGGAKPRLAARALAAAGAAALAGWLFFWPVWKDPRTQHELGGGNAELRQALPGGR